MGFVNTIVCNYFIPRLSCCPVLEHMATPKSDYDLTLFNGLFDPHRVFATVPVWRAPVRPVCVLRWSEGSDRTL